MEQGCTSSKLAGRISGTVAEVTLLFGEIPTQTTSSRKNFWCRCRGDIIKITEYLCPNYHPLAFILFAFYLHLPLVFISPTSNFFLQKHKNILFACLIALSRCLKKIQNCVTFPILIIMILLVLLLLLPPLVRSLVILMPLC